MLKENIIITDIGSTTTKALLLQKKNQRYCFIDYSSSPTTVEFPEEDVKIGIYAAIKSLEERNSINILNVKSDKKNIVFNNNFTYLTTSSAGDGLQILVIGLTLTTSVLSAMKVAYGVGGVILASIGIDDHRNTLEKLKILNDTHPDIILFCGGVDGGALYGVYRLAEILNIAAPTQKFSKNKIPLIFAGNTEAIDFEEKFKSK